MTWYWLVAGRLTWRGATGGGGGGYPDGGKQQSAINQPRRGCQPFNKSWKKPTKTQEPVLFCCLVIITRLPLIIFPYSWWDYRFSITKPGFHGMKWFPVPQFLFSSSWYHRIPLIWRKLILEVASTDSQGKRWIFKSIQAGWLWCHVFGDRIHS